MRGATARIRISIAAVRFLLTRPMRGATYFNLVCFPVIFISTHTPHAGRDNSPSSKYPKSLMISTHTPHAGRDSWIWSCSNCNDNFYSHAPCGARHVCDVVPTALQFISTHTPHAGRDADGNVCAYQRIDFYSHAPCGARQSLFLAASAALNFYSHAPCGARPFTHNSSSRYWKFLLTRPMRGATATYSIRNSRTSYIQEADSKIIAKYMINLNILHDSVLKSRRTSLSYTHHLTFACYSP